MPSQNVQYDHFEHIIRTSAQWAEAGIANFAIPRGVLCIELFTDGTTKLKVGEGNKFYRQLPYVGGEGGGDLSNYYTKEEVDRIITNLKAVTIPTTRIYPSKESLPIAGNKLGEIRFVENPGYPDPITYLWNESRWISIGGVFDIDLSEYVKRSEIMPTINRLDAASHTHPNKPILDATSAAFTIEQQTKLRSLENYDDTEVKSELATLERKAHTHNNIDILNATTANYTTAEKQKLASLHNYEPFTGATSSHDGASGLVPAPTASDYTKFLCADGTWKSVSAGSIDPATTTTLGGIIVGAHLTITPEGVLSAVLDPPYELPIAAADTLGGIKIGENLSVDSNGVLSATDTVYTLPAASSNTLGGVKVGDGLSIDQDGVLSAIGGGGSGGGNYTAGDAIEFRRAGSQIPITNLRFFATAKRSSDTYFQMSELEFYDTSDNVITFSSVAAYVGESSSSPSYPVAADNVTKLFDGDITTKMCCYWYDDGIRIDMVLTTPITVGTLKSYRYCTGNDFPARDPVSWTVFASSDNGLTWFTIDTKENESIPTDRNTYTISFPVIIGIQAINVKYGDGLSLDQNGALTVTGGGSGTEYTAGDGISIDPGSTTTDITSLQWSQGSVRSDNGELDNAVTTAIRSPEIEVGLTPMLNVSAQTVGGHNMKWKAVFYDSAHQFISMTSNWQTFEGDDTKPANASYFIIVLRDDPEMTIDENDLLTCELSWPIEIGKYVITNTGVTHLETQGNKLVSVENGETTSVMQFANDFSVSNGVVSIPDYQNLVLHVIADNS